MVTTGIKRTNTLSAPKWNINESWLTKPAFYCVSFVQAVSFTGEPLQEAFYEKKLQKVFAFGHRSGKFICVGYRGKMFHLSDLLFHVIRICLNSYASVTFLTEAFFIASKKIFPLLSNVLGMHLSKNSSPICIKKHS
ncbi:hypothetical protein B003_13290 [Vibrio breoganii 1C10]|nr:hypothetical protein B003_13290 [Vibrio breoganii 1C10]